MEALLDWIIPADESPGAHQAGVIHYIDRQLMGHYREHRKTYRDGLPAVARLGGGITQAPRDPATRAFFELVVTHAMQGFYADPRHGGNSDFVSWRMLGLPPVQVRGRDRRESGRGGGNAQG
jgi:gluconate 2-dehydrogenase gamma chain